MKDQDVRKFLERMAAEEPIPFFDAAPLTRRAHRRAARTVVVGVVGVAAALAVLFAGVAEIRTAPVPADNRSTTPLPTARSAALAYGIGGDVYVADADGANAVRIADGVTVDGADECVPGDERGEYIAFGTAWSPDGRYLAYWDWGCPEPIGAWGTVRITDTAGNLIATFPGQGWQISWSPDSTRVAVMDVWGEGDSKIGVYGLDGKRQEALTVPAALTPSGDYSPVWSRDGSSILLPGVQVPLDGKAPTPLPADLPGDWGSVYSPDGSRVASVEHGSLIVENAARSPDAVKVSGLWEFWNVAWSPNSQVVAYAGGGSDISEAHELLVRDLATGVDTSLLDVPLSDRLNVLEFSLDGERILFTKSNRDGSRSLWSIGVDGSDLRRLVERIEWADLRPQVRPS